MYILFFRRFRFIKLNPRFSHLYVRNSLPYKTRLLGKILYHAYILKLTPIHTKPIFNTYTNSFVLHLYIILFTGLFHQLPYLQLSLLTGNLPTLNLNLPFPHLVISPLILIQTPHLIILLNIPTPFIFM